MHYESCSSVLVSCKGADSHGPCLMRLCSCAGDHPQDVQDTVDTDPGTDYLMQMTRLLWPEALYLPESCTSNA